MKFNLKFVPCILFLLFSSCEKKENKDQWSYCSSCTIDSWIGTFSGTGTYTNLNTSQTESNINVQIAIAETAPDYLMVDFESSGYMSITVNGEPESAYIISFAGSGKSVTSTLYIKENVLRMSGNAKKFHYKTDTLVMDEIVNFEVYKE